MRRGLISLGDAVRAAGELQPDAEAAELMLRVLGLEREVPRHEAPALGVWKASSSASVLSTQRQAAAPPVAWAPRPAEPAPELTGGPARASTLTPVRTADPSPLLPEWALAGEPLGAEALGPAPPPPPLFGRITRRGLLGAALATPVAEGDIDVDAAVATLAAFQPLRVVPRRAAPTLRRGVQLLLDRGAGMLPFLDDQETLLRSLDDILSDDRLEIRYFAGCPARGAGGGDRDGWRAWQPPAAGTPVLAVTDLGLGGDPLDEDRATTEEWLAFAHRVSADGHRLLALVPYEATRWPAPLARAMILIHWSERTTVAAVRRALREAWGRAW